MQFLLDKLHAWYPQNARQLPWRNTDDPYKIWLSEIIMQQTRIEQGTAYYLKFVQHYPTIFHLAKASEEQVLHLWQGLGYYTRARNLHYTAKEIVQQHSGQFPSTFATILKLKGVGTYTAAAIASFAFNEPTALVDGNVYRFLSRYFDIATPIDSSLGKKQFQQLADSLLDIKDPRTHNQAMMEFGALQCIPQNPNCQVCVMNVQCMSFLRETVKQRPMKEKKTKIVHRYFYYALFREDGKICIRQRTSSDIWKHLYEFPLYESDKQLSDQQIELYYQQQYNLSIDFISQEATHLLSHRKIFTRFVHFSTIPKNLTHEAVFENRLSDLPLPRPIDKYWTALF